MLRRLAPDQFSKVALNQGEEQHEDSHTPSCSRGGQLWDEISLSCMTINEIRRFQPQSHQHIGLKNKNNTSFEAPLHDFLALFEMVSRHIVTEQQYDLSHKLRIAKLVPPPVIADGISYQPVKQALQCTGT
jgi:hypothetical protein